MKFNKQICFFMVFFALGFLVNLTAFGEGYTINLIKNPSFEVDDDYDGLPDCWYLINNYPNDYYLDSEEKLFGDVSLKMETYCHPNWEEHYKTGSGGACLWLDVEPNTTYTISYFVKTENPESVLALPSSWEYDADGNFIDQHYEYLSLSPGWQRVVYIFTTHPDADVVKMWLVACVLAHYSEQVSGWKEGEFYTSWLDGVQVEKSDSPSPFHTTFNDCDGTLQANIHIYPNTLNLKSRGKWITCFIELPEGYDRHEIDANTILLNDSIYAGLKHVKVRNYDRQHVSDLKIKFNRKDLINYLRSRGIKNKEEVELTVEGKFNDGTLFGGSDTIRIRNR